MGAIKSVGKVKKGTKNIKLKITGKAIKINFLSFVSLPFYRDTAGNNILYVPKDAEKTSCGGGVHHLGGVKARILCYMMLLR